MMGLSRNTVAKALNDDKTVALGTRAEVVRLAKELGYAKLSPRMEENSIVSSHVLVCYYNKEEVEQALDGMKTEQDLIVCASDAIAKYVILYLRKKGIRVLQDIWVTGFDNTSSNAYMDISLTTINVRKQYIGRRLARQILWRMEEEEVLGELIYVAADPVFGESAPVPLYHQMGTAR